MLGWGGWKLVFDVYMLLVDMEEGILMWGELGWWKCWEGELCLSFGVGDFVCVRRVFIWLL